jgi:predicted CoA-substrate-specific enzyme activase
MYTLGLDIGSTTSKCVIINNGDSVIATSIVTASAGIRGAEQAKTEVLGNCGISDEDIAYSIVTGYGRKIYYDADEELSELSCHAAGCKFICPEVRTIIDIGGQDAKVICLNDKGKMQNFVMNDKCAAGTGRFLDVMANILKMDIDDFSSIALGAENAAKISSTCTVFAESEVISQLASGEKIPNVAAGICNSVSSRVAALVKRIGVKDKVFMSGGVAKNAGVRYSLEKELNKEISYSSHSQLMGALGAAILAHKRLKQGGIDEK